MTLQTPEDNEPRWISSPPRMYDVVTGFFPETCPKARWMVDPRPMLVCGVRHSEEHGLFFCRVAYGTSQHLKKADANDLVVGNISYLNQLGLAKPTRFVTHSGDYMAILPWISEFFQPWSDCTTPIRSSLPEDMQKHVGHVLANLKNLPQF